MIPQVEIDAEIRLKDINARLMRLLAQFAPFGPANQKPLFVTRRVIDYGTTKLVGKGRDHIKFELIEECSGAIVRGIGFSMKDHLTKIQSREPFDIVYSIEENVYNGVSSVQLMIKDLLFPY
jgi:single-stranded-DNA-specific exonuclease